MYKVKSRSIPVETKFRWEKQGDDFVLSLASYADATKALEEANTALRVNERAVILDSSGDPVRWFKK